MTTDVSLKIYRSHVRPSNRPYQSFTKIEAERTREKMMATRAKIEKLKRRIKRLEGQRQKYIDTQNPEEHFTYHGGYDHGYIEGKMAILYGILDDLESDTPQSSTLK